MSYIKNVLQPGETIRYQGSVHWILYLPPLFLAVVGAIALAFGPPGRRDSGDLLFRCDRACIARLVHPLDDGNRRHGSARDLCARVHQAAFGGMHTDKIESVDVDQSVFGRLFNYGTVTIHGTGTTLEPLRGIDRPIEFRNQVTAT